MSRHKREVVDIKSLECKLVSADSKLIKIYDLEKQQNDHCLYHESFNISCIDFKKDSLIVGDGNALKIYDLRVKFNTFPVMYLNIGDQVNKVSCYPSGDYIGCIGDEGCLHIIDARNTKELVVFKKINRHENIGSGLEFRSKRRWEIVSGGYDSSVFLSDFSNAQILQEFSKGEEEVGINAPFVTALKFKENGNTLGIGRFNGIIQIQESKGGTRKNEKWEGNEIRAHRYAVMDLDFYKDFMISTGLDGALSLWDLQGNVPTKRESVEFDGYKFNSLSVLKYGALDKTIKVAVGGFTLNQDSHIFIHDFQLS